MRYWFDTEFIEDGKTIDLISIGMVAEDGREFYAESRDANLKRADQWVRENVLTHLVHYGHGQHVSQDDFPSCPLMFRATIKQAILRFCDPLSFGKPEFWGWCSGFDYVVLSQLFGGMEAWPSGWPYYIRDIQQSGDERGIVMEDQPEGLHHALSDARWIKHLWEGIYRGEAA